VIEGGVQLTPDADGDGRGGSKTAGIASSIDHLISKTIPSLDPKYRAFVVVSGALAILLLGVVFISTDPTTAKLATLGILAIVALNSLLVFFLARECVRTDDYTRRRRAAESVNGKWWQLVVENGNEGRPSADGVDIVASVFTRKQDYTT